MSGLIGGLFRLPLAEIIGLWGRPQGYLLMIFFITIGLVPGPLPDRIQSVYHQCFRVGHYNTEEQRNHARIRPVAVHYYHLDQWHYVEAFDIIGVLVLDGGLGLLLLASNI
ncbi:hypothetical protein F4779DRAFT_621071 [Xylariaceae sp. FL0662B]|nr:hypothetical protein F4779DRAFT_621071 [Xylariaceae sp. FL0662B]